MTIPEHHQHHIKYLGRFFQSLGKDHATALIDLTVLYFGLTQEQRRDDTKIKEYLHDYYLMVYYGFNTAPRIYLTGMEEQCFTLRLEEKSYQEIAKRINIPLKSVDNAILRAKRTYREAYQKHTE